MEQKRKVKNLISIKSKKDVLLSTLLILLGGVLFLGAIGLWMPSFFMPSTVVKASVIDFNRGIENKAEEILNMSFAPQSDLSDVKVNMYLSGKNFYISGAQLILSGRYNEGASDKNINILGGKENKINSDNISIIGGSYIETNEHYDSATILGGNGVSLSGNAGDGGASVTLGGQSININKSDGNVMIGGLSNNLGVNCKYCFILGGINNRLGSTLNTENVIAGGSGVKVDGAKNVFIFSDGNIPLNIGSDGSNAFYFIVKNGVGLGEKSLSSGVTSKGPVKFGAINFSTDICKSGNIGVIGTWNGCLVGCTEKGANSEQWELIDNGDACKNNCKNNGSCMVSDFFGSNVNVNDYLSYCTGNVNISNTNRCAENLSGKYKNVVYEKKLISFDKKCSDYNDGERCVFKCDFQHPFVSEDGKRCESYGTRTCMGVKPENNGNVWFGPENYEGTGYKIWKQNINGTGGSLGACEWNCKSNYVYDSVLNKCKLFGTQYGGQRGTQRGTTP